MMFFKSSGAMMIPAACKPVLRTEPSNRAASFNTCACRLSPFNISRSFFTFSKSSPPMSSFSCKLFSPSFFVNGANSILFRFVPALSGTSLASILLSANGRSSTRATSFILILAAIVPNVTICATWFLPYFSTT